MGRTTISVTDEAHARADATRDDGESWTEWVERATAALEDDSTDDEATPCVADDLYAEFIQSAVAVENVDEIARRTADEVETRMTRR